MNTEERTINLEPSNEGYARIGRQFAEQVLADVRKARQASDRMLLVECMKIAALLATRDRPLLARLLVALEQDESVAIMPSVEAAQAAVEGRS